MLRRHPIGIRQAVNALRLLRVQAFHLLLRDPGQQKHLSLREFHRLRLPLGHPQHMEPRLVQKAPAAAQPLGAVVVPRNGQHPDSQLPAEPVHSVVIQPHRRSGGHRPVVNIPGNQHRIHPALLNNAADGVNEISLVFVEVLLSGRGTQVPVGGVKK